MLNRRDILKGTISALSFLSVPQCFALSSSNSEDAMFWKQEGESVRCLLCPRNCKIDKGKTAPCRVRKNIDGKLITLGYSNPCAVHVDPIEKKPLYHLLPGSKAYSIAIAGCNLRCKNCQNYTISQASPLETRNYKLSPEKAVEEAIKHKCTSIAYTYSEPIVWYEYMYETAKLARKAGLKNCMITCGYINPEPLNKLCKYIDAVNIDLKSFSDDIYKKLNAGHLKPVLEAIKLAHECGTWVELTNLIVPKWTDDPEMIRKMCAWIVKDIGEEVPLHFSRFSPMYKLAHLYPTPKDILIKAKKIAEEEGLKYVYVGNVAGVDSNTYCPKCHKPVVKRWGYLIKEVNIDNGKCRFCGYGISGQW